MSDNIPFEVQVEIIKRFPVKSLKQFRSVSKRWKSMIDSSQFIAEYNACQTRPQCLLIRYEHDYFSVSQYIPPRHKYVCIVDDDNFPQHKFHTAPNSFKTFDSLRLVGSSQGLLCLHGEYYPSPDDEVPRSREEMAIIWNPSLNKSIAIEFAIMYDIYTTVLGFGVCPNTDDPMIVKINDNDYPTQVDVCTLSSPFWRNPRSNLPRKSIPITQSQVAINGFIYWQTWANIIVSFDMTSEEFSEIILPNTLAYQSSKEICISQLKESVAMLQYYTEADKPICDVWRMEHVTKSFTKLFRVTTPNESLMKVLGFRKNDELILDVKTNDYEKPAALQIYEPCSKHIKDIGIYGEHGSFSMSPYMETLLLHDELDGKLIQAS